MTAPAPSASCSTPAGLLSSPEVSGWFESYGDPGPGQWVTIYASAGHVLLMDIDGESALTPSA